MGVRALLVYPEMPPTYWSMSYSMRFLGRKAAFPPLGLLTVAAMLPPDWDIRLIDLNVEAMTRQDVDAADLVLTSAMLVQRTSLERLIAFCRASGKPIVAGGPYPTHCHQAIAGIDHFILGEAEVNLPTFLRDFESGTARPCYDDASHPDISGIPPPRFDLAKRRLYVGAALQFSRGCPHTCEFCDIVELFGRAPRTKGTSQFLGELDTLYNGGWRGSLFVVDDNFIGNRKAVRELLPEVTRWQAQRGFPFSLFTESSLDLAADEDLMDAMVGAGFNMVFVGIETPDQATLAAVQKRQNCRADLLDSVQAIQRKGMEVSGGFIVGFDQDQEDIFDRQIRFIEEAAIPTAMVGLLTALPGTKLAERLASEGRLLETSTGGNNTHDLSINFVPRMETKALREGYKRILGAIYSPRNYFSRCLSLIGRLDVRRSFCRRVRFMELRAFLHSLIRQTFSHYAASYWEFLLRALLARPLLAPEIIALAVKGHHFFTITDHLLSLELFRERLEELKRELESRAVASSGSMLPKAVEYRAALMKKAWSRYRRIHPDLREHARELLDDFQSRLEHGGVQRPLSRE